MKGSQASLSGDRGGPQLPGMENLGEDAIMMGGIETDSEIPEGMEFIPSSVPDGEFEFSVASNSEGLYVKVSKFQLSIIRMLNFSCLLSPMNEIGIDFEIEVQPVCMTFEDFYASFSPESHPCLKVSPETGRMDRRGGETSVFVVRCEPKGQAGDLTGDLVINLPEDNSKICYKIKAKSF